MSIQINKRVIWIASVFMIQEYLGLQEGNSTTHMTLFHSNNFSNGMPP